MSRRIVHIIPSLEPTGQGRQLCLLARGLPRDLFDVHVCVLNRGGLEPGAPWSEELAEAGIPVTRVGRRLPIDPQAYWRLRRHLATLRPDVVHTWTLAGGVYGYLASRACGARRVVAAQCRPDPHRGGPARAIDRLLASGGAAIATSSAVERDDFLRHGLPAATVRLIPAGVAPAAAPTTTRAQMLAKLRLPERSRLVGVVGRLERRKRIKDAIWAADLLKVIRDDVHLLVIGDGPLRERLIRFRDQAVIRDKVHFLGPRGDVLQWLPHLDVLWSASACEGHSSAILEAMAAGVPVVATDIPGTRDLVVPEVTGVLVRLGHRAGLVQWTNHLLDHPELARQLGEAGRQRAMREFSADKMIRCYAELYREMLG